MPEPGLKKKFFLVRLFPADYFFSLRGSKKPDKRYLLKITIRGDKTYEVRGLKFSAILLGASDIDLIDQAKETRHNEMFPRNYLKKDGNADKIIAEWLDEPLCIQTRELKPGDSVTVELTPTLGSPRIEIPITSELNEQFLMGAPK